MSNESENRTEVWFTLREFMDFLRGKNERLYEEALDCVSSAVAEEYGEWLHPDSDWDSDEESGDMCVCLTNIEPRQ